MRTPSYGIWAWVFCRNGMALLFLFSFYLSLIVIK
uniref:Cytochrome b6/f complex subunit VIII n=4 Tax=Hippophae TaxID=48233 RepID=A0A7D4ZZ32_9ROSA|nr:cytochrome b6/f complex subunit VIII [Hippophae rhamnoides subsp. sinensis]QGW15002.1 cytochrome b6/f complex subunit VIII [Hippophae tibetana]QWX20359.1 cytochrome b6/f complex subunit VIII [Hippophae neurocarpa]QWX20447.1 cytochrome b6/f complex subunit VIII [Hippophae goniocarpa]QKT21898.1 cytochrome b6/f complex subunit VIII [Hippophae rhamnoides subsp. sinensis]QWX20535.1 cytochrome b6/f complex subunit VIII [Hippophae rhamnoides subsp. sinensis]